MAMALRLQASTVAAAALETGKPILVIEDEDDHFALLQLRLSEVSPETAVIRAHSLAEGKRVARLLDLHLVFLDLHLPDARGLETLSALRRNFSNHPVVVLTSHNDTQIGLSALQYGAMDFIDKPSLSTANLSRRMAFARERHDAMQDMRRQKDIMGTMIASLGHDLKSPPRQIAALCDQIETTLTQGERDKIKAELSGMRKRCSHLNDVLTDTLSFARNARQNPNLAKVSLAEIVAQVGTELGQQSRTQLISDIPLTGDPTLIFLIVKNLVGNGLKYWRGTPSNVEIHGQNTGGHSIIRVTDNGMGIAAGVLPHVFEPTVRGVDGTEFPGTGFGLSIVHAMAQIHGGQVQISSQLGQGTEVTLSLPLHKLS